MLSAAVIKHIASLRIPKFRELHRQTVAEGSKLIREMLLTGYPFEEVFCTPEWADENSDMARSIGNRLTLCSARDLERISNFKTPQGVLALIPIQESLPLAEPCNLTLLCDHISDPGNLGTILRVADWFGIHQVIATDGSASFSNPKVIQASMGSLFRVHHSVVSVQDLPQLLPPDASVYAAVMDGNPLSEVEIILPAVIVVGNESNGISPEILSLCQYKVTIPGGAPGGHGASAESLNAGIAAALLCYHFTA